MAIRGLTIIANYTMSTFIKWYPELKKRVSKYLVPVAVGLNKTQPYAESNVVFPVLVVHRRPDQLHDRPSTIVFASGSAGATGTARPSGSASLERN